MMLLRSAILLIMFLNGKIIKKLILYNFVKLKFLIIFAAKIIMHF